MRVRILLPRYICASSLLIGVAGCDVSSEGISNEEMLYLSDSPNRSARVIGLVENADQVTDDNEVTKDLVRTYRSLSGDELDEFNLLRMQKQMASLEVSRSSGAMSRAQYDRAVQTSQLVAKLRIDANRIAQDRYGKPSNALDRQQLDPIIDELMETDYSVLALDPDPSSDAASSGAEIQACTQFSFPSTATNLDGSGPYEFEYASVTKTGQSDCDWRFSYFGTYRHIDPDNLDSELLVWDLGDQTAMAHYGQYIGSTFYNLTRIILGANRVWFWCGGPSGVYIQMN